MSATPDCKCGHKFDQHRQLEIINYCIDNDLPPMNFGVADKEMAGTIEKMEGGRVSQTFLISNEPLYIEILYQFFSYFIGTRCIYAHQAQIPS